MRKMRTIVFIMSMFVGASVAQEKPVPLSYSIGFDDKQQLIEQGISAQEIATATSEDTTFFQIKPNRLASFQLDFPPSAVIQGCQLVITPLSDNDKNSLILLWNDRYLYPVNKPYQLSLNDGFNDQPEHTIRIGTLDEAFSFSAMKISCVADYPYYPFGLKKVTTPDGKIVQKPIKLILIKPDPRELALRKDKPIVLAWKTEQVHHAALLDIFYQTQQQQWKPIVTDLPIHISDNVHSNTGMYLWHDLPNDLGEQLILDFKYHEPALTTCQNHWQEPKTQIKFAPVKAGCFLADSDLKSGKTKICFSDKFVMNCEPYVFQEEISELDKWLKWLSQNNPNASFRLATQGESWYAMYLKAKTLAEIPKQPAITKLNQPIDFKQAGVGVWIVKDAPLPNYLIQDQLGDGRWGPKMVLIPQISVAVAKTETTFFEFDHFTNQSQYPVIPSDNGWGKKNRPVVNVSWYDAERYTQWLSQQTDSHYRLPTADERDWMVQKATAPDKNMINCKNCRDGFTYTSPAASFSANNFLLYDFYGNIWEWFGSPEADSQTRIHGGGYNHSVDYAKKTFPVDPEKSYRSVGFRVVRELN